MMIKWLKPGENWDDIDRQVLTYGLGPEALLMGGLPIDMAEELGKSNKFPAEYLDETAKKTEKSNLGKYLLLGLGLTAAIGIVSIGFNKFSKSEQGQQITSQPSTGLQTGEQPQIAPQEPFYQTQPQEKGIIGSIQEDLEKRAVAEAHKRYLEAIDSDDPKKIAEMYAEGRIQRYGGQNDKEALETLKELYNLAKEKGVETKIFSDEIISIQIDGEFAHVYHDMDLIRGFNFEKRKKVNGCHYVYKKEYEKWKFYDDPHCELP